MQSQLGEVPRSRQALTPVFRAWFSMRRLPNGRAMCVQISLMNGGAHGPD